MVIDRAVSLVVAAVLLSLGFVTEAEAQEDRSSVRVATYNLRNYLLMNRQIDGRFRMDYPKPESEKSVVRKTIREANADLLAVQEIGSLELLEELRGDLADEGLVYTGLFVLEADDETRKIGALWKSDLRVSPIEHVDMSFSLFDERRLVKRGMLELRLETADDAGAVSVFVLHLKSRYTSDRRDPGSVDRRTLEAEESRDRILDLFPDPESSRFMVVGDLNDYRNSASVRRLLSRGDLQISRLLDIGDDRGAIWTHFYEKGGEYSLIDYILCSPAIAEDTVLAKGILADEAFFDGSDHRLVWVDLALGRN